MNQVFKLLKLLRPGQDMEMPKERRNRRSYTVFGGFALLFIMIPCCIVVGVIAHFMTLAMIEAGGKEEGMLFIIQFLSACAMIFGFNVIINEFYFSSDIDYLLPLPVKTHELILAKFIVTYLAETVMEFLIIFSAYIGYILAIGISPLGLLTGIIGTLSLPLVPLLYCGMISMLIMYLFQGIRSRKMLNGLMAGLAIVLIGGVFLSFHGLEGFSVETYVQSLTSGENAFMKVMNVIFYPGYLLVHSAAHNNWLEMLLYLILSAVCMVAFLGLANIIYMPGLYSYKSIGNKQARNRQYKLEQKERSIVHTLFGKELKMIFRTPAFVTNCIIVNIFWPVLIVIVILMQKGTGSVREFTEMYHNGNVLASLVVMAIILGLAALTTAANSLASGAFTREGAHIDFMKYIPVPYELQIKVKLLISLLFSAISFLIDIGILTYILDIKSGENFYYICGGFAMIFFISCLGLVLDSNHPKLIWEDELNALRGNLNVFFNMAFAILATAVIVGTGFLMYLIPHSTVSFIYSLYVVVLLLIDIKMYDYMIAKTKDNLEQLEP